MEEVVDKTLLPAQYGGGGKTELQGANETEESKSSGCAC